jgi:hypothetical protein
MSRVSWIEVFTDAGVGLDVKDKLARNVAPPSDKVILPWEARRLWRQADGLRRDPDGGRERVVRVGRAAEDIARKDQVDLRINRNWFLTSQPRHEQGEQKHERARESTAPGSTAVERKVMARPPSPPSAENLSTYRLASHVGRMGPTPGGRP